MPALRPAAALDRVLDQARLLTPPAVAMQVVRAASDPSCSPTRIAALLSRDPALCARVLKAVNSCALGGQAVASLDRAVVLLGLNPLRSLVLGLSLPVVQNGPQAVGPLRDFWIGSVGGGLLARELSARDRRPSPEGDMVAGLLRDLGGMLLQRAHPDEWAALTADPRWLADPCGAEDDALGLNHADVSAELLRRWNLPAEIVDPIRHHHHPHRLADGPKSLAERAELLQFVEYLTRLDAVAEHPDLAARVLATAKSRFGLSRDGLIEFLHGVVPKIEDFARMLTGTGGGCADAAAVLAAGCDALVRLAVEAQTTPSGGRMAADPDATDAGTETGDRPAFRPAFAEHFPPGGCSLDGYDLVAPLGRGAMGVVFRGFDPGAGRDVAVKVMNPELAGSAVARGRFEREGRAATAVRHPNAAAVYAVGTVGRLPYLVMEYVRGGSLQEAIDRGPWPTADLGRTAGQLAAGLAAAHAKGIVHRDVKPANVLVDAAAGVVKISDFGTARGTDDVRLTADGSLVGTPLYTAPELIHGRPADARSDLFSLGGVLYALCTGRPPFPGETVASVYRAIVDDEPVPPRAVRPDVPRWLEGVVMRLLRKNPGERFASAADVAAACAG